MSKMQQIAGWMGYSGGSEFGSDSYFPYVDHIADDVMLLADQSRLIVIRMHGAPFSLVMNRQRNGYKRRLTAFLNAVADDNVEVHLHLVKHDAILPPSTHGAAIDPYAADLLGKYHASIEPDLAVLDWFLSVRVKPRTQPFNVASSKIKQIAASVGLSAKKPVADDPELDVQIKIAVDLALGTLAPFKPVVLGTRHEPVQNGELGETLAYSEIAEFLYLLRTTQFSPQPMADVLGFIGAGIAAVEVTAVSGKSIVRLDHAAGGSAAHQTYAAVLGFATYPRKIDQLAFDKLMEIPGRFVLTVAARFQSRAEANDSLDLLIRRLRSGNSGAKQDTEALEDAIEEVAGGKGESAISRWSLVLHEGTEAGVDRLVSAARTVIVNSGAKVTPERNGRLNAFLAQLPGAPASTWIRPARCSTRQLVVLASMNGYSRGPAKARWGKHLFRLISPAGTAYDHDLFVGDVGHNFIPGPNGEGKSVWMGMNIAALDSAVGAAGGTQIVLDVDESNHNVIMMLGGNYSKIDVGRSGVAPLRGLPNSPRVRYMIRNLIAGLVQTDGAPPPTKAERDDIRNGVDFVMNEMAPEHRRFSIIRGFMGSAENGAGERLEPWCHEGELGWVFDGDTHEIDFDKRLVGADITAIMNDERIMPPVAMLLLWMASEVMDGRRVVVWAEEAPAYMPTPAFAKPFKGIALRARKRNASFNALAQQPSDMLTNEAGLALIKQARQIIAFRNDKAVEEDYCAGMGFTEAKFRAVREGMFQLPYRTVLINRQDGENGIYRFDLSSMPEHLEILSSSPKKAKLLRACMLQADHDRMKGFAIYQSRINEVAA